MFALFTVSGCADVLDLVEVEPPPVDVCGAKRESGSIHVQGTLLDATNNAPIVGLTMSGLLVGAAALLLAFAALSLLDETYGRDLNFVET